MKGLRLTTLVLTIEIRIEMMGARETIDAKNGVLT
jgi:hypothetical protein